jgi:FMN-dependent oxidoreductase (nitrilotriacetate monooxygenase family)
VPRQSMMKLAVSAKGLGYHVSGWRRPDLPREISFGLYQETAQVAEASLFDMVFVPDLLAMPMRDVPAGALGRGINFVDLEPMSVIAGLVPLTTRVGLAATMSTTFQHPYHIARQFASIDHMSGGRAAWNVVTSMRDEEARNFGMTALPEKGLRYERAREAVEVVTGLWDGWDEDAFVRDRDTGVYFDSTRIRTLDHEGTHFTVRGPLNAPRFPANRPILIQAGASPRGLDLAAEIADVTYAVHNTIESAQAYNSALRGRLAGFGRRPEEIVVMPGLFAVVGDTDAEARAKHRAIQELVDPLSGLAHLSPFFGDLSGHDLDGPVPETELDAGQTSRGGLWLDMARRDRLTIRQLYQRGATSNGHLEAVGTPRRIADIMEEWFTNGAADGFTLVCSFLPSDLHDFTTKVVPELQRRGLFRTEYEGTTLRENLGLPPVRRDRV